MSKGVALYARVSSEKQAQEGTIESQISAIKDYAQQHGIKIDSDLIFVDNGVSGATLARPALDSLRDKVLVGSCSGVTFPPNFDGGLKNAVSPSLRWV